MAAWLAVTGIAGPSTPGVLSEPTCNQSSAVMSGCRYVVALVDDSPTVRQMARILVADVLKKMPQLAHNQFLELVFLLNKSMSVWRRMRRRDQGVDGQLGMTDCTSVQASKLAGPSVQARARRFEIYKVQNFFLCMLRQVCAWWLSALQPTSRCWVTPNSILSMAAGMHLHMVCVRMQVLLASMQPIYKFQATARLVDEVIASAADGQLPLGPCSEVIHDVLELIGITEMQIDLKKGLQAANEDSLDDNNPQVCPAPAMPAANTAIAHPHSMLPAINCGRSCGHLHGCYQIEHT